MIWNRLKEPSTHAALAALFVLLGQFLPPQYSAIAFGLAGLFGSAGVAVPEKGSE